MLGPGAAAEGQVLYTTIRKDTVGRPEGLVYFFFFLKKAVLVENILELTSETVHSNGELPHEYGFS